MQIEGSGSRRDRASQPFFTTDINCCWPAVSNKLEDLKRHDQKLTIFSPYLDWVRDNPTSFLDLAKNCDAVHYNKILMTEEFVI